MVRNRWPSTNACHRSVGPWSRAVERIIHIESRPLKGAGNARCAIVERTAMRDEDFGTDLNLAVGDDGDWSPPEVIATQASRDWRSRFEQERARADAAEARAEELRCAEVDSRARAGSLKWQLDRSRSKLKAATEEAKEARRAAKDVHSLRTESARLQQFLSEAGIDPGKVRMIGSPRDTVAASEARRDAVGRTFGQERRVRVTPEGVRRQ